MTTDEAIEAIRAFAQRRVFRHFIIDFYSGGQLLVTHPEAIIRRAGFFVYHSPDNTRQVFTGASVCRVLDVPRQP